MNIFKHFYNDIKFESFVICFQRTERPLINLKCILSPCVAEVTVESHDPYMVITSI